MKKQGKSDIETWQWNNGKTNYSSEEGITYQKKEENKNSTIETKFDKFGNKVSMLKTLK